MGVGDHGFPWGEDTADEHHSQVEVHIGGIDEGGIANDRHNDRHLDVNSSPEDISKWVGEQTEQISSEEQTSEEANHVGVNAVEAQAVNPVEETELAIPVYG